MLHNKVPWAHKLISALYLGAAKLVVAVAVFLLTFYVISQVFEIKMDASLGSLFGKFHFFPFLNLVFDVIVSLLLANIESPLFSLSRKENVIIPAGMIH